MSDEPAIPGEQVLTRDRGPLGPVCEHAGCGKDAGWGFARPKQPSHWFCFEHCGEGERFL
ncbi:MAG: hypothetical protein E5X80_08290 [Mesorhizobium sp.]|uniref:hypothetical protein n=1 Tax=Mesorhizobium sp. TaxID=1871066 RepID=UPI000FE9CA66|nr:hypothetical protein [Mesorhizobium sp.]RWM06975.1 MAG: hypothetical protein EOR71_18015 [Mesorhizobium sp.]TIO53878.1 MAG: hypothetical protein E5X78_05830 [Mesorhizobium sp.]TIO61505.1 MAG: hypothetical protein E5X79_06975 [Mesorhizobium sp.]TJV65891.1 MAG: hypothetical protein E5X80_08290 [Mesorhizobium sp.]